MPPVRPTCTECGYDLSGHRHTGRCPECGVAFDVTDRTRWMRRPRWGYMSLALPGTVVAVATYGVLRYGQRFCGAYVLVCAGAAALAWYNAWRFAEWRSGEAAREADAAGRPFDMAAAVRSGTTQLLRRQFLVLIVVLLVLAIYRAIVGVLL